MLSHLYGPTLTSVHDWWKNHSFDYTYLCSQSDVSAFEYTVWLCHSFPSKEQVSLNFIPAVTVCSDFGTQENKTCHCFHFFPFYLPWSERPDAMNRFLMFSFKLAFAPSFFTFIKRLYSTCWLFIIRMVSLAYLRLLIFLLAILIPVCDSSSPTFCKIHSAYKLNK